MLIVKSLGICKVGGINLNKKYIATIIVTAAVSCLVTNTVRDIIFVNQNGKFMKKIGTVMKVIDDRYLFDIDEEKIANYAALGMTVSLDEPYTHYYDKESFQSYKNNVMSSYIGVGTSMVANSQTNEINIVGVYENSPAEKAGILPGDKIVALNGNAVDASSFSDMAQEMRGGDETTGVGSELTVTIVRNGGEPFDVKMTREFIAKTTVSGKMLDNEVAYIRISEFSAANANDENSKDTYEEFKEKLSQLRDEGMTRLIIDMRNNPGGDLDVAMNIADEFLPQCTMAYTMNKKGEKYRYRSDSEMMDMPLVILVNENSASASEAVTAAVKSQNRGTVVGKTTYGKGIVQNVIPLTDGSGMSVTSAKYYTEDGQEIHQKGVEPDVEVELKTDKNIFSLALEEDTQLKTALEKVKNQ